MWMITACFLEALRCSEPNRSGPWHGGGHTQEAVPGPSQGHHLEIIHRGVSGPCARTPQFWGGSMVLRKDGIYALFKSWSLHKGDHLSSRTLDINTWALTFQGPSGRCLKKDPYGILGHIRHGKKTWNDKCSRVCDLIRTCVASCKSYKCIFKHFI